MLHIVIIQVLILKGTLAHCVSQIVLLEGLVAGNKLLRTLTTLSSPQRLTPVYQNTPLILQHVKRAVTDPCSCTQRVKETTIGKGDLFRSVSIDQVGMVAGVVRKCSRVRLKPFVAFFRQLPARSKAHLKRAALPLLWAQIGFGCIRGLPE